MSTLDDIISGKGLKPIPIHGEVNDARIKRNEKLLRLLRAARTAQEYSQRPVTIRMRSNLPVEYEDIALNTICDVVCALLEEMLKEKEQ